MKGVAHSCTHQFKIVPTGSHFFGCATVLLMVGCVQGTPPRTTQRDSASVQILESVEAQWMESEGWEVSRDPLLVVGMAEGAEPYLFNRLSGAIVLSGGDIAVADNGSHEIRLFDSTGAYIRSLGREGSGPGEFRDVGLLIRYGTDSVLVFDRTLQRATVLSSDLQGFRTMPLQPDPEAGVPSLEVALDDGSVIARLNLTNARGQPATLWRDSLIVMVYDQEGGNPTVLIRALGDDRYTIIQDDVILNNNHPFGRRPVIASDGSRLFLAEGSTVAVDVYTKDGQLEERWRAPIRNRQLDNATVDRMKAEWKGEDASPEWSREVERIFSGIALPSNLPAVDAIIVDVRGYVWLKPFAIGSAETLEWHVFSSDGVYLGGVALPGTLQVTDIGIDYVLGVGRSELGTEEIHHLSLRRS